jgi:hypothetical protein
MEDVAADDAGEQDYDLGGDKDGCACLDGRSNNSVRQGEYRTLNVDSCACSSICMFSTLDWSYEADPYTAKGSSNTAVFGC